METHFVEAGDPGGMPVVFIHGFPFSHAMWQAQLSALGSGRRLVAYDVRGHGDTPPGDGLYTIDLFVDDLLALLDHLDIKSAILCGLSMGGYIALRAANRAPARVRGLILADTRAEADANQGKFARVAAAKTIADRGMDAFAFEFAHNLFSPKSAGKACVGDIHRLMAATDPLGARGALLALAARPDATPWLPLIKVPTLVVVGEDDALTPPALSQTLAASIPGARLAVIAAAGHLSPAENPEEFNRLAEEFLSDLR